MIDMEILTLLISLIFIGCIPFILTIIGLAIRKSKPQTAKMLYLLSGIILVVGLGICATILKL